MLAMAGRHTRFRSGLFALAVFFPVLVFLGVWRLAWMHAATLSGGNPLSRLLACGRSSPTEPGNKSLTLPCERLLSPQATTTARHPEHPRRFGRRATTACSLTRSHDQADG